MFLRNQFPGQGVAEIPLIHKTPFDLDNNQLIGYDQTKTDDASNIGSVVHFFQDDYKFECLWNNPKPRLSKLKQYAAIMTPQFSIYTEMPAALHMYNIFRSRWVGAYYQAQGLHVIPTVYWGLPQSYWFCFDGIEKGSTVAVTTLGVRKEKDFFLQGYNEMLRRIEPENIICYCEPFPEMKGKLIVVDYAQTNHLSQARKLTNTSSCYIVNKTGYVIRDGFGSAGGGGPGSSSSSTGNTASARDSLPENAKGKEITYRAFDVNNKVPGQRRNCLLYQ